MSDGAILHTSNGGSSWEVQYEIQRDLRDVHFVDDQMGWAFGDKGAILKTVDGGINWEIQSINVNYYIQSVSLLDAEDIWIACRNVAYNNGGTIFHSNNGGNTWVQQAGYTDRILSGVFFVDQNNGWAVGETSEGKGFITHTNDGGLTWQLQIDSISYPLNSVHFTDLTNGQAAGGQGTIIYTEDGGETWDTQQSGTSFELCSIYFSDEGQGWIAGDKGTILHNDNGGMVGNDRFSLHPPAAQSKSKVLCYPNPVLEILYIEYALPETENVTLTVIDLKGNEIRKLKHNSPTNGEQLVSIDVSCLPAGIYLLRLQAANQVETCKLIVID
jgi:hypothetical protein